MASPVDTSVKHFHSAMAGAPVLTGTAGSLIALLDACLVDGFGLKSVTSLVVAGGIATMTFAGGASAAAVNAVILVAGATPANLNGEQKVLSATATSVTFATAEANITATGTITFKMAPLGWVKVFTGTNLAVYKSTDPASNGMHLRVSDTGTTTARVIAYESMSDVDTGSGPFPTNAQMSGGGYWHKSNAANSTPAGWTVFGDPRSFFYHCSPFMASGTPTYDNYTGGGLRGFGDMIPLRPSGDAYACVLSYGSSSDPVSYPEQGSFDYWSSSYHFAMPRAYTGLGTALLTASRGYIGTENYVSGLDLTLGAFPSVVDGSLRLSRCFLPALGITNPTPRCEVPGVYRSPQAAVFGSFGHRSTVPGTGALIGRTLMGVTTMSTSAGNAPTLTNMGVAFVDITGPWR